MAKPVRAKIDRNGCRAILGYVLGPLVMAFMYFWGAGTTAIPHAWIFFGVTTVVMFASIILIYIDDPNLLNIRGSWKKRRNDYQPWDKYYVIGYGLSAFYFVYLVAGLDVRYSWTTLPMWLAYLGYILFGFGVIILHWAMVVNTHFETGVRIQKERKHKVISSGPYQYVRHPGYVGACLWSITPALILGSLAALIPGILGAVFLIIRTSKEDALLQKELSGYKAFCKKTKYRLMPFVW